MVDGDRVVDRDVDRQHRVEARRIAARLGERRPHRRDVDERRHAGGVVHQDAAGDELDLRLARPGREPVEDRRFAGRRVIRPALPQHVLQQQPGEPG